MEIVEGLEIYRRSTRLDAAAILNSRKNDRFMNVAIRLGYFLCLSFCTHLNARGHHVSIILRSNVPGVLERKLSIRGKIICNAYLDISPDHQPVVLGEISVKINKGIKSSCYSCSHTMKMKCLQCVTKPITGRNIHFWSGFTLVEMELNSRNHVFSAAVK